MKLETLFDKFDQLAGAPDAVAKMRDLVLQVAVQGRLVPQLATDGTAEELLARLPQDNQAFAWTEYALSTRHFHQSLQIGVGLPHHFFLTLKLASV